MERMALQVSEIPDLLNRIVLVLDRPRDVANVGGVVRAMGNFGLGRLRLVEPAAFDEGRVRAMAHRGSRVLERLERHATLDGALADCGFVLGTTARSREVRHERMTPRQAAPALLRAVERDPTTLAAILFGPEDRGLDNEALGRCNAVVTIPTAPDDPSLNLAQSALLIAYELWLAATASGSSPRMPDAAAALDGPATLPAPSSRAPSSAAPTIETPEAMQLARRRARGDVRRARRGYLGPAPQQRRRPGPPHAGPHPSRPGARRAARRRDADAHAPVRAHRPGTQRAVGSCQLPVASCQLPVASCQLPVGNCRRGR